MSKRLDIQSLLEKSHKEDLVRFLRSRFAQNKDLANDFIIHFASTFELDETEFEQITNRIKRMMLPRPSGMTLRKARQVKVHIMDLIEQTRDCHSRQNYRQAYIIVSHVITLLDQCIDQIPNEYGYKKLLEKSYKMLDDIFKDSPAQSLKTKITSFLKSTIQEGKAIPFDSLTNPYTLLLRWEENPSQPVGQSLIRLLTLKVDQFPEFRNLWIAQLVQLMVDLSRDKDLIRLIETHANDIIIYESLMKFLPEQTLNTNVQECLLKQYKSSPSKSIKNTIYQILRSQNRGKNWMAQVAIEEYFTTGDLTILDDLDEKEGMKVQEIIHHLENHKNVNSDISKSNLYNAYRHMGRFDLLKKHLLEEQNIFEILPFLDDMYPLYREEIRIKLSNLIEVFLETHFGRPAINHINSVMEEISRLGHHGLHDYLIREIRHSFGHRKHFQKMMKELAE